MAIKLKIPLGEEEVRALNVGDQVLLSGVIFPGRDAAHKYMIENFVHGSCPDSEKQLYQTLKEGLAGSAIFHCGPVVKKGDNGTYEFVAAGPTTSIREEPYQADVIARYGLRGVIGKGGMAERTLMGLGRSGAVYLHAIGGAAQVLARAIPRVEKVFMLEEFGVPEALWVIEVERFPVVVTMDSHGGSLHDKVDEISKNKFDQLLGR